MLDRATRLLLILLAGIILGLLICFFVPLPYVDAQGVGFFGTSATGARTNCTQITGAVVGQTACFDQAANAWKVYTGASSTVGNWVSGTATQTGVNNVRDFGAVGDGVTDDSAAINAAITAAKASSSGVVYLPPGTYLVGTTINLRDAHGLTLQGGGPQTTYGYQATTSGQTTILGNTGVASTDVWMVVDMTGATRTTLRSLNIRVHSGLSAPSYVGVQLARSAANHFAEFNTLEDVQIAMEADIGGAFGGRLALVNIGAEHFTAHRVSLYATNPLYINDDSAGTFSSSATIYLTGITASLMRFEMCTIQTPSTIAAPGTRLSGTKLIDFVDTHWIQSGAPFVAAAVEINPGTNALPSEITFRNTIMEQSAGAIELNSHISGLNFYGASIDGPNMTLPVISFSSPFTISNSFIQITQTSPPVPQPLIHNFVGAQVKASTLYLGTSSGIGSNVTLIGTTLYANDAVSSAVTPKAGSSYLLLGTSTPSITNLSVATAVYLNATQTLWSGEATTGAPLCTNNCGTSPTVRGTNSAMRVTMGATGTPRSPFLVLFNGTWNATPSCIAQLQTATTTTATVANATATGVQINTVVGPAQGDVYAIHCLGVG